MRLTPAHAAQLARLAAGGSLQKSSLSKTLLPVLQEAGVVRLEKAGSSYRVRGIPGELEKFVQHHWGIRDLKNYAQATPEKRSRGSLAEIAGDSKALPTHPLTGILMRCFGDCFLQSQSLGTTPCGSALLISPTQLPRLEIRARTLIAIENSECLLYFEKMLPHFPELRMSEAALVLRWSWGTTWQQWIRQWQGTLLYCPDYDPSGLVIFGSEVLAHRPDAHLLVPDKLKELLVERGSRSLYLRQEPWLNGLHDHSAIQKVKLMLKSSRKALEQESLLYLPAAKAC
jgi:hypothetical protein